MLIQIVIGLMALGTLITGLAYYHHSVYEDGFHDAEQQYKAKEENTRMEAERTLAAAIKAAQDKQTALQAQITDISTRRKREQDHADAELQTLRNSVAAGRVRVSVPSVSPRPLFAGTAAATATAAAGTQPEARCDIDPKAADDLISIAAEGDAAIRQSSALIDTYNAARGDK